MEEDNTLDFNQPFLSVRRFAQAESPSESEDRTRKPDRMPPKVPRPPPYRSELKSGPLRKPGTVPFTWEQSPGRPKFKGTPQDQIHQRSALVPKLPPGRTLNPAQYESQNRSHGQRSPEVPMLPSGGIPNPKRSELIKASNDSANDIRSQDNAPASNLVAKHETHNESIDKGMATGMEDGDETYYDAPDTLGRSESFFYNCSISGLSGLDGPDIGSARTFATDPQVQDFMMDRFLPAAKAIASETPPHSHAPRKRPPAAQEQPRFRLKQPLNVNNQRPLLRYNSSFLSRYMMQASGSESEDGDDDTEPENSALKLCGLLPRFMMKSSFCTADPEQDTGKRNVEKRDPKSKPSKTNRSTYKRDSPDVEVSVQSGHLNGKDKFPGKIMSSASQSLLQEDNGTQENGCTCFRDLLASEGDEWRSSSGFRGPVIERTLYIDSVQTKNSRSSGTSSVSVPLGYRGIDFDANAVHDKAKEAASVESLPRDIKEIDVVDVTEIPGDEAREPVDPVPVSSVRNGRSNNVKQTFPFDSSRREISRNVPFGENEIPDHTSAEFTDLNCSEPCKFPLQGTAPCRIGRWPSGEKKIDMEEDRTATRPSNHGNNPHPAARSTFHIPPLRPRSPAESWLFRTLPSISSRKSPARFSPSSHETEKFQLPPRSPSTDSKRETIVRATRPSVVSDSLAPAVEPVCDTIGYNCDRSQSCFRQEMLSPIQES